MYTILNNMLMLNLNYIFRILFAVEEQEMEHATQGKIFQLINVDHIWG